MSWFLIRIAPTGGNTLGLCLCLFSLCIFSLYSSHHPSQRSLMLAGALIGFQKMPNDATPFSFKIGSPLIHSAAFAPLLYFSQGFFSFDRKGRFSRSTTLPNPPKTYPSPKLHPLILTV